MVINPGADIESVRVVLCSGVDETTGMGRKAFLKEFWKVLVVHPH